jgi:hypothetical protein
MLEHLVPTCTLRSGKSYFVEKNSPKNLRLKRREREEERGE